MADAELARRDKLTPAQRQILDRQDRYSRKARRRNIASGMRGFVNIKSDADYRAFLAEESKGLAR